MSYKKILAITSIFIIILQMSVYADFKKAEPVSLENGDGSYIEAFVTGDEYVQVLHDADEYVLVKTESGFFEYAILENNELVPCGDEKGIKYAEIPEEYFVLQREKVYSVMEDAGIVVPRSAPMLFSSRDTVTEFKGKGTVIVVPIAFSGGSGDFAGFTQSVENACEYFKEVSYGELDLGFYDVSEGKDVFVSAYSEDYYRPYDSTNNIGYRNDSQRYAREEALAMSAISHYGLTEKRIDAPLDVNGDGENDFLVFVYNTEKESVWSSLLWPHQIEYTYPQHNILGKDVRRWIFMPRSNGDETLCHEMYHAIGAEDLYGYADQSNYLGMWDIMDSGNGTMLSYMKYRYGGWIDEIPEITEPGTYTLNPVHEKTNTCYKIPINDREYYVVEYRNRFSGRINCLDRWRQWHNEGLIVMRVDSNRHGKGNVEAHEHGAEIRLVTHPALGINSVLGAVLPEFSPESGFDRTLASGGVDDRTVIKNIRENADGTLSFDLSFDGETTQAYEGLDGVEINAGLIADGKGEQYLVLFTQNSDGTQNFPPAEGKYNIKYIYLTGRESSAKSYEYNEYDAPFKIRGAGIICAYLVDSYGKRVGDPYILNLTGLVQGINTARGISDFEYTTGVMENPSNYKLAFMSFEGGDKYVGKLNMDNVVTFTVDGVEYEFLSEDIRGKQLVFAADNVDVHADDGSEVYMNGLWFSDYKTDCNILFDSGYGRSSIFEKAETIMDGDRISLSVPGGFAGEIRYTLDGTTPTVSSALYKEPISLYEDANLVVASFLNGELVNKTNINVYVQDDYREYSVDDLNKIFKNSGSAFSGGSGKYLKVCYTKGEGTLVLRNSDWLQVGKIINPQDSGVIYIDAGDEIFVQEASGDNFLVSVVDSSLGIDMSILKNADSGGLVAVHSFDSVGDFEVVMSEFSGDRFMNASTSAVSLEAGKTQYCPFTKADGTLKVFCFESLEKLEPKGPAVSK